MGTDERRKGHFAFENQFCFFFILYHHDGVMLLSCHYNKCGDFSLTANIVSIQTLRRTMNNLNFWFIPLNWPKVSGLLVHCAVTGAYHLHSSLS